MSEWKLTKEGTPEIVNGLLSEPVLGVTDKGKISTMIYTINSGWAYVFDLQWCYEKVVAWLPMPPFPIEALEEINY